MRIYASFFCKQQIIKGVTHFRLGFNGRAGRQKIREFRIISTRESFAAQGLFINYQKICTLVGLEFEIILDFRPILKIERWLTFENS